MNFQNFASEKLVLTEPAVVAGIDLNGLGVLRSLGQARVPVAALDTKLSKPTLATRFGIKIKVASLSGPAFVEELLKVRQRFDTNPVLFLTQEASVATVSAMRDQLSNSYRFTMPAHSLMAALLDKLRFQALAEQKGFPIPRALRVSRDSGAEIVQGLRFPCVLKPTTKLGQNGTRFAKAYKVGRASEVEHLWSKMHKTLDEIIVQEWIEGGDSDIYFCLQYRGKGRAPSSFVGRKICQWPPLVGGTASCAPAPEVAAELTALTDRFFDAVGFSGIGSMEYKRDVRDGRFYMVEPTVGRTDYQEEIATLNGVNIPLSAYLGELGAAPPIVRTKKSQCGWRDPFGYAKARQAGSPDLLSQLSPGIKMYDAYFRADDPMPFFALKLEAIRRRFQ